MSKKFELPPMVGVDPSRSPRTGRLRTLAEIEALARAGPAQTTLGFSNKPGAVAAGISGRYEREVDPAYTSWLQQTAHTEQGALPLTASGVMSATSANARAIGIYNEEVKRVRILLDKWIDQQWGQRCDQHHEQRPGPPQHRLRPHSHSPEHGPAQQRARPRPHSDSPEHRPAQQRARPRSRSPEKYPVPKTIQEAFAILEISSSSTPQEIRKKFKDKAKLFHPDKHRNKTPDVMKEKEEQFKQLVAAIELIDKLGQNGGRNKSYRVYRKLKKHIHHRSHHRRRNTRHTKRSNKSSKRYSKTHRR